MMCRAALLPLVALLAASCAGGAHESPAANGLPGANSRHTSLNGIRVRGNRLVDGTGNAIHLQGVNRSGTEYACIQGWGIFDGPSDSSSVQAIASWNVTSSACSSTRTAG